MERRHKLEGEAQIPGEDPTSLQGDKSRITDPRPVHQEPHLDCACREGHMRPP